MEAILRCHNGFNKVTSPRAICSLISITVMRSHEAPDCWYLSSKTPIVSFHFCLFNYNKGPAQQWSSTLTMLNQIYINTLKGHSDSKRCPVPRSQLGWTHNWCNDAKDAIIICVDRCRSFNKFLILRAEMVIMRGYLLKFSQQPLLPVFFLVQLSSHK